MARITINENVCKGCGLCASVCPKKLIVRSKDKINSKGHRPAEITNQEECIGCKSCAMMCPDVAIIVER